MKRHLDALCVTAGSDRASIAPQLSQITAQNTNDHDHNNGDGDTENDSWIEGQEEAIRRHRRPRRCLFTPLRVSGAPPVRALAPVRVTEGQFCDDGKPFRVVDCWTSRATAHRPLERAWTGVTKFLRRSDE